MEAPREAVEFARMLARAFYPDEMVVLLDAVLRTNNNYCPHFLLSQRLGIPPKELRQMMNRMVQARLMRCDKRQQKKFQTIIDYHNSVKGEEPVRKMTSRLITTEFWYVPLGAILDAFNFRVHKLDTEIRKRKASETQQHKWTCTKCHTSYQLLDILQWNSNDQGLFICEKMGVRADRRPAPCSGLIKEEDNSFSIRHTEKLKQMLDIQLRPLIERSNNIAGLAVPNHPLEKADDKTWELYAPQNIGPNGEKVDEDGIPVDHKGGAAAAAGYGTGTGAGGDDADNGPKPPTALVSTNPINADNVIPDKPTWFKDQAEDADDDWDHEQNVIHVDKNIASSINADEEKAYMESYLREIGGVPQNDNPADGSNSNSNSNSNSEKDANENRASNGSPSDNGNGSDEIQAVPVGSSSDRKQRNSSSNDELAEYHVAAEADVTVYVDGEAMKLSQVSEDMYDRMSDKEYSTYVQALQKSNATGADDDDDDME